MMSDFSECKTVTQEEIRAEELALLHKLSLTERSLLFSSDLTTKEYQDVVLARK